MWYLAGAAFGKNISLESKHEPLVKKCTMLPMAGKEPIQIEAWLDRLALGQLMSSEIICKDLRTLVSTR
jgi:hypothetical protein